MDWVILSLHADSHLRFLHSIGLLCWLEYLTMLWDTEHLCKKHLLPFTNISSDITKLSKIRSVQYHERWRAIHEPRCLLLHHNSQHPSTHFPINADRRVRLALLQCFTLAF